MKRKKGFTLIELLAVIVILAIIALITVPTVIKIINNAKKGAAEDSTYGAVEAAKLYWASHATFDNENESEDVTFTCGNDGCKYNDDILDISGDKPSSGTITISNGNVTASNLVFGNFTCNLSNDIVTCGSDSIPEPPEKKYTIVNDVNSNGTADIGDEIALGDEHFYVISNDGTNINALAKYNLNIGGEYNGSKWTEYTNPTGIQDSTMSGYVSGQTIRKGTTAFSDSVTWNVGEDGIEAKATGTLHDALESYKSVVTNASAVRLITKTELAELGCKGSSCSGAPAWVYSTSYWVGSAGSDYVDSVWFVYLDGGFYLSDFDYGNNFGVRPVITIAA